MKADLYLHNGLIVNETEAFHGGVVVADGKVTELVGFDADVSAARVVDLDGKVLMPGLVDAHVHWNDPGRGDWEGYERGSMAAAAGGVTTAIEMPLNAHPPTIDVEAFRLKREAVQGQSVVDYALWGGLVDNNLDALEDLHAAGIVGFKAFMSRSGTDDFRRVDDDVLYAGMLKISELGSVLGVHAENDSVTAYLAQRLQAAGRKDRAAWPESRPPGSELEAIQRAVHWATLTGARTHLCHVSIADGVHAALKARRAGYPITVETCPHYLLFDQQDFLTIGPDAKCAPPIRSRAEVERLWERVLDGSVDTIASDHSPCPTMDKEKGKDDIWQAWGGITGIQCTLPAMMTEGIHRRGLTWPRLVRLLCANPARIFGLYPRKGALASGSDADLVVVNPQDEWIFSAVHILSKHKHSAYLGRAFKGRVELTLLRGRPVYENGRVTEGPRFGELLRQS